MPFTTHLFNPAKPCCDEESSGSSGEVSSGESSGEVESSGQESSGPIEESSGFSSGQSSGEELSSGQESSGIIEESSGSSELSSGVDEQSSGSIEESSGSSGESGESGSSGELESGSSGEILIYTVCCPEGIPSTLYYREVYYGDVLNEVYATQCITLLYDSVTEIWSGTGSCYGNVILVEVYCDGSDFVMDIYQDGTLCVNTTGTGCDLLNQEWQRTSFCCDGIPNGPGETTVWRYAVYDKDNCEQRYSPCCDEGSVSNTLYYEATILARTISGTLYYQMDGSWRGFVDTCNGVELEIRVTCVDGDWQVFTVRANQNSTENYSGISCSPFEITGTTGTFFYCEDNVNPTTGIGSGIFSYSITE